MKMCLGNRHASALCSRRLFSLYWCSNDKLADAVDNSCGSWTWIIDTRRCRRYESAVNSWSKELVTFINEAYGYVRASDMKWQGGSGELQRCQDCCLERKSGCIVIWISLDGKREFTNGSKDVESRVLKLTILLRTCLKRMGGMRGWTARSRVEFRRWLFKVVHQQMFGQNVSMEFPMRDLVGLVQGAERLITSC